MITTMPEPKQAKLQFPHTKLKNQLQAPFIVSANSFGEDGETWDSNLLAPMTEFRISKCRCNRVLH